MRHSFLNFFIKIPYFQADFKSGGGGKDLMLLKRFCLLIGKQIRIWYNGKNLIPRENASFCPENGTKNVIK